MVRLRPMTESEFETYLARLIPEYAQEHLQAGSLTPENALQESERQTRALLPDGVHTEDQYLYVIEDEADGTPVGVLWFARQDRGTGPHAFVYDVEIDPAFRRRGYGSQAFRLLENKVRELGLSAISLHVFGHNHAARAMYTQLGYDEKHVIMTKTLDDE